jgi:hypothetical protein
MPKPTNPTPGFALRCQALAAEAPVAGACRQSQPRRVGVRHDHGEPVRPDQAPTVARVDARLTETDVPLLRVTPDAALARAEGTGRQRPMMSTIGPARGRPRTAAGFRRYVPWQGPATRVDVALMGAILGVVGLGLAIRPLKPFLVASHPVLLAFVTR